MATPLNPQQAAAVAHRNGPLLVLAGAGTGKTRVVTERIAGLVADGVPPAHILAVTFTNKAAGEMRERIAARIGKRANLNDLVATTFHSLAVRLLRRNPETLGYRPGFTICDRGEQLTLIRKAARTVRGSAEYQPEDLLQRIGDWKNDGLDPDVVRRRAFEDADMVAAGVYRRYQEALKRLNALDFDDLLNQATTLLAKNPEALAHWRDRFRYLLVDEFQDTNAVQYQLVQTLAAPRDNLCVVGDDDQSIYAWRGARAANLLEFPRRYPNAAVVTLEQNYRSVNNVLRVANAVIVHNTERRPKTLRSALGEGDPIRVIEAPDQFEEALRIVDDLRGRLAHDPTATPADFAIILRSNMQGRFFEEELRQARIPYVVVGGQQHFDREEMRDTLAYLAVIANPTADAALLRIANVPARGLGEKSLDALAAHAAAVGTPLLKAFATPETAGLTGKPAAAARELAARFDAWRTFAAGEPEHIVGRVLADIHYEDELTHRHEDPIKAAERHQYALDVGASLRRSLDRERERGAAEDRDRTTEGDGLASLARFVQDTALWGDGDGKNAAVDNAVTLITGHSAKGLEYPHVYIPGVEEGLWPHKNSVGPALDVHARAGSAPEEAVGCDGEGSVAEERRLFYVAITRARRTLTFSRCLARSLRGKNGPRAPSRFLGEIPPDLLRVEGAYLSDEDLGEWLAKMAGGPA